MSIEAPRWDLNNVYPGLESTEFNQARDQLIDFINRIENILQTKIANFDQNTPAGELGRAAGELIAAFNQAQDTADSLGAYIYSFVSTDSTDALAKRRLSELEKITVKLKDCFTQFKAWTGSSAARMEEIISLDQVAQEHAFFLREMALQSKYLMSKTEESLAAELSLSGSKSWEKLQGTITSQIAVDFELDGRILKLSLPEIINLHSHRSEEVRHRAYEAEINALSAAGEPLAACLNGIKGAVCVLNRRRGRSDALHSALERARIDRPVLEAMLEAMRSALPSFRSYFRSKARRLGKQQLAWWDLYAPVGAQKQSFSFDEGKALILQNFQGFSPDLADFARGAFERNWIDAQQRTGKQGGAFCMDIPSVKESRILSNFDGNLDQVTTIAHELGHGYHNYCAFRAGKTAMQRRTPMTLAETASIMCETIVMQAALKEAQSDKGRLAILETMLTNHSQVIVDIFSRFLFEKEVFARRENSDLSVQEICRMMEEAQIATYGDGLDQTHLNGYMWAWKPHYYSEGLSFYNFPYAFGLLFGLGLYAIYQKAGAAFVPDYQRMLASTGEASPVDLASGFGIDIREPNFWKSSLMVIDGYVRQYLSL